MHHDWHNARALQSRHVTFSVTGYNYCLAVPEERRSLIRAGNNRHLAVTREGRSPFVVENNWRLVVPGKDLRPVAAGNTHRLLVTWGAVRIDVVSVNVFFGHTHTHTHTNLTDLYHFPH